MKKSAVILEGGSVRGVFTSGALDYLMEKDFYFPYVVGVSAGSCNAVDYVSKQIGRTRDCMIPGEKSSSYFDVKQVVKQRSLFNMDLIFDTYPNEVFPFDYDTYFNSGMECDLVVTNCITGKAEYLTESKDAVRLMKICRASCSMPVVSPMVEVDGVPYLDGGIADSIPIIHALKKGYQKNVLILTRAKGYRKKVSNRSARLYLTIYRKYPELAKAIWMRPYIYNKTLSYIEKWEEEGKIFVLRPRDKAVSRTEQNPEILTELYEYGYKEMKKNYEKMLEFLEK